MHSDNLVKSSPPAQVESALIATKFRAKRRASPSIRSAMGVKKRSLSWSGAANHAIKITNAQQLGV
jgi:hypothetical protein